MSKNKEPKDSAPLQWEKRNHIGILTLNRPKALNAFDLELMEEHVQCLREFEADDDLWVLVYTGNGRAFSSGVDINKASEFLEWDPEKRSRYWVTPNSLEIKKPAIAAVIPPTAAVADPRPSTNLFIFSTDFSLPSSSFLSSIAVEAL